MSLIWITGNSGVGKSTVCEVLRARGYVSLDTDEDGFSRWVDRASNEVISDPPYPVPEGWLDRYGWRIDREKVRQLAEASRTTIAFLCGSAENEAEVRDLFDSIICLVIDDATLTQRLATRTNNTFGQNPEELAAAIKWNSSERSRYLRLGAAIVDGAETPMVVADNIVEVLSIE